MLLKKQKIKLMKKIAERLAHYFVVHKVISKCDEDIYVYGSELLLEGCLSILLCLSISALYNQIWECIILFLIFIPIRIFGGGLHFKSYFACLLATCSAVCFILFITQKYTFDKISLIYISIISLIMICFFYPVEHPDRPITEIEKRAFQKVFFYVICINFICVFLLFFLSSVKWNVLLSATYIVIAVSMFLGKIFNNK